MVAVGLQVEALDNGKQLTGGLGEGGNIRVTPRCSFGRPSIVIHRFTRGLGLSYRFRAGSHRKLSRLKVIRASSQDTYSETTSHRKDFRSLLGRVSRHLYRPVGSGYLPFMLADATNFY